MKNNELKIIFLSDMHLTHQEDFLGIDTFASFDSTVTHIQENHNDADYVVLGGDFIQDQKKESFEFFYTQIRRLKPSLLYARGNHDISDKFYSSLRSESDFFISTKYWEIIMLETYSKGNIFGEVCIKELKKLVDYSFLNKDKFFFIYMHHNLFMTQSPWLDIHITKNREEVLSVLKKIKNLRLVINGHIHQETNLIHEGIEFYSSPSTSAQFTSGEKEFKLGKEKPGYLIIKLRKEGLSEVKCQRIIGNFGTPDKKPKSY